MKLFSKKTKKYLNKKYVSDGVLFSFQHDKVVEFPLSKNNSETFSLLISQGEMWSALEDLWNESLLESLNTNTWRVPYSVYEKASAEDYTDLFKVLGLPLPIKLDIEAKSEGSVADQTFMIRVEAHHPDHGPLRDGEGLRCGPVFHMSEDEIVPLSPEQCMLFDVASETEHISGSIEDRMSYLARVKQTALASGAKLDGYLNSEDYHFADEAEIDIQETSSSEITLVPKIKSADEFDSEISEQLLADKPPAVITKATSATGRKRLVIDNTIRDNVAKLPKDGKVTGADVPRLLTNPEQVIPEGFDLSLFSERVKGIKTKVYNSRPYLHVQRSTGGWFEGVPEIQLEDESPGESLDGPTGGGNLSPETYKKLQEKARETGEEFIQSDDGSWIRVDPDVGDKFEKVLNGLSKQENGTFKIPKGSMLEIYENLDLLEFVHPSSLSEEDTQLPEDLPNINAPGDFPGKLHPHQLTGYRWLNRVSKFNIGGLLADDMGLGKTIQIIAHMVKLKEENGHIPHLIVVPKSLMENWAREIYSFSNGNLSVCHYDRSNRNFDTNYLEKFDVVLTTYDTLRRDQAKLATINWNLVACDEAQYVKNPTAIRTSAIKALKSKHRAALTGTPVENGLIEFWCIMDFVQPGLLGSWSDFRTKYERPIVEGDEDEREKHVQNLFGGLKGHYLRRMKEEILKDLPGKTSSVREVSLGEEQLKLYRGIAHKGKNGGKGAALGAIQQLLMLCAHPMALTDNAIPAGKLSEEVCPKLEETLKIIAEVKARSEKVIIFSDFKKIQNILREAIIRNFGLWPDKINGEVIHYRQEIIDVFSEKVGFNVLILGHQVGGVGLNITAANHVIHYTRPWNPAKENQATDRVHRIGQTRPVNVYYPIVKNEDFVTVEQVLNELIQSKEALSKDVLRPSSELKVKGEDLFKCLDV